MQQWLKDAVFYEIYPQSFCDSNGDGIGDLPGITSRLDYIRDLGCNALWINPCFDSPFKDAGYDVRDYKKVAPRYGTNGNLAELFRAAHEAPRGRIHTCLDSCGYAYDERHPERFDAALSETDMVLLDIKHSDPTGHRELTGCNPERIIAFGDELARRGIKTVIRHVIVPGITDTEEECEALGRLIAPWRNVVGLELLPYHTMGIVKYEKLGIPYKLEGVPQMDKARIPALRESVLRGIRAGRTAEKRAYGA